MVTRTALEKVYQQLLLEDTAQVNPDEALIDGEMVDPDRYFHVIDAFKMPRVVFDERRKTFEKSAQTPHILAAPRSNPAHLRERLQILQNVVLRNENFLPPLASGVGKDRDTFMRVRHSTYLFIVLKFTSSHPQPISLVVKVTAFSCSVCFAHRAMVAMRSKMPMEWLDLTFKMLFLEKESSQRDPWSWWRENIHLRRESGYMHLGTLRPSHEKRPN